MKSRLVLCFSLIMLLASLARALGRQPGPAPTPFLTDHATSFRFHAFEDDQGGFYLAWTDAQPLGPSHLRVQHFDAEGHPIWPSSGVIVTDRLQAVEHWNGLADGKGGLDLFWNEADGIHAQRFRSDGSRQRPGPSVLMSTTTALEPDAIPDVHGGTYVVWSDPNVSGEPVLRAQHLDSDGKPLWVKGGIRISLRASQQTHPRIVYDNMGGFIAAWRDFQNQASALRMQRVDSRGTLMWGPEGLKVYAPAGESDIPKIVPLGKGDAVVSWSDEVTGIKRIFLQKVGPEAKLAWGPEGKNASEGMFRYHRWNPILAGDDQGGSWISWEDARNQEYYQLRVNHLNAEGQSVWTPGDIAVAPASGHQGRAAMTSDGQQGAWLAWIDNRGSDVALYVQRVSAQGKPLLEPAGHLVGPGLNKPSVPKLLSLAPGRAVACWANRSGKMDWSLYWTFLPAALPAAH